MALKFYPTKCYALIDVIYVRCCFSLASSPYQRETPRTRLSGPGSDVSVYTHGSNLGCSSLSVLKTILISPILSSGVCRVKNRQGSFHPKRDVLKSFSGRNL